MSPPKAAPKASLRDTIAAARAAARKQSNATSSINSDAGVIVEGGSLDGFNFNMDDPFGQAVFELGGSEKVMKQRIKQARFEGRLNIAAMQLSEIPKDVYRMYDMSEEELGGNGDDGPAWYESVDLVKLMAADNEIVEIGVEMAEQFPGLSSLDLHNNLVEMLPGNFTGLTALTTLNLVSGGWPEEEEE